MKIIQTTLTPSQAGELLGNNPNNRLISPSIVRDYVQDMSDGKWMLNGETIKIYNATKNRKLPITKHRLLDGQHRLTACVRSNIPLNAVIAVVDDPDVFKTIDTGKKRSTKDCLDILGYTNTGTLAASLALIKKLDTGGISATTKNPGGGSRAKVMNHEIEAILADYPKMPASVAYAHRVRNKLKTRPAGMAVIHYRLSEIDVDLAEEFLDAFHSGAGLSESSPIYQARNRIINKMLSDSVLTPFYLLLVVYTAWNYWITGNENQLRVSPNKLPKLKQP